MPWKYLKDCDCGCDNVNSDNVTYYGPNLPCTGVNKDDSLSLALQKIDQAICNITSITTTSTTSTITTATPINCYYWQANIIQEGIDAPQIVVIDTNFPSGYTVLPLYAGVGKYFLSFSGLPFNFIEASTMILTGSPPFNYTKFFAQVAGAGGTALYLETRDILSNELVDDILENTSIYIKNCLVLS